VFVFKMIHKFANHIIRVFACIFGNNGFPREKGIPLSLIHRIMKCMKEVNELVLSANVIHIYRPNIFHRVFRADWARQHATNRCYNPHKIANNQMKIFTSYFLSHRVEKGPNGFTPFQFHGWWCLFHNNIILGLRSMYWHSEHFSLLLIANRRPFVTAAKNHIYIYQ